MANVVANYNRVLHIAKGSVEGVKRIAPTLNILCPLFIDLANT
jgi:hypothetical protein